MSKNTCTLRKCFLGVILSSIVFHACNSNKTNDMVQRVEKNACDSSRAIAASDYKNNALKFYYIGIANPPASLTNYLRQQCGINVIGSGCQLSQERACYNTFTEEKIHQLSGKTMTELMVLLK